MCISTSRIKLEYWALIFLCLSSGVLGDVIELAPLRCIELLESVEATFKFRRRSDARGSANPAIQEIVARVIEQTDQVDGSEFELYLAEVFKNALGHGGTYTSAVVSYGVYRSDEGLVVRVSNYAAVKLDGDIHALPKDMVGTFTASSKRIVIPMSERHTEGSTGSMYFVNGGFGMPVISGTLKGILRGNQSPSLTISEGKNPAGKEIVLFDLKIPITEWREE